MDHYTDLARKEPERVAGVGIVDGVDGLNLQEVIAGAEAAHLEQPPAARSLADSVWLGTRHRAAVLALRKISIRSETVRHRVSRTVSHQVSQLVSRSKRPHRSLPHATGSSA
jgi:hypothetical protein